MKEEESRVMTETAIRLTEDLLRLSANDRIEIIDWLRESLDAADDQQWQAELDRRFTEMETGVVVGRPAAEMFAELQKRYS